MLKLSESFFEDPLPMCALCRRPVRKMTSEFDFRRGVQVFRVYCHGDTEETEIDWRLGKATLEAGVAFTTPKLTVEKTVNHRVKRPAPRISLKDLQSTVVIEKANS